MVQEEDGRVANGYITQKRRRLWGWMADPITCRLLPKHLLASDLLLVTKVVFTCPLNRSSRKSDLMVEEID
jgi:hypothetical protein